MFETVDRALWEEHLARVEQRTAESEGIIARQRAIIEGMERANLDVRTSRELLAQFEQLLELQVADRDRLRQAIDPDETTPAPAGSAGRDKGS